MARRLGSAASETRLHRNDISPRAISSMLAANLERLMATGLPIYSSELDLNLDDDADHANVMRRILPIFWDHRGVVDLTHSAIGSQLVAFECLLDPRRRHDAARPVIGLCAASSAAATRAHGDEVGYVLSGVDRRSDHDTARDRFAVLVHRRHW